MSNLLFASSRFLLNYVIVNWQEVATRQILSGQEPGNRVLRNTRISDKICLGAPSCCQKITKLRSELVDIFHKGIICEYAFSSQIKKCVCAMTKQRDYAMHMCMNLEQALMKHLKMVLDAKELSSLAERTGIDQGNLSRIARGQQKPGLDKVSSLLEAFGAIITFPGEAPNIPNNNTLHTSYDLLKQQFDELKNKYEELKEKSELQSKLITMLENQGREDRALSRPSSTGRTNAEEEQNSGRSVHNDVVSTTTITK